MKQVPPAVINGHADAVALTPLLQTNFLPDVVQVYLTPETVFISPLVLQVAPVLTAAKVGTERDEPIKARAIRIPRGFFMLRIILSEIVQAKGLDGSEIPPHRHKNALTTLICYWLSLILEISQDRRNPHSWYQPMA